MLLNNENVDLNTFEMAIIGGNNEIIRIIDNEIGESIFSCPCRFGVVHPAIKLFTQSISRHQNDIFDWMLETKKNNCSKQYFEKLAKCAVENGNVHALIQIYDN